MYVGFLDHRRERLLGHAARLQEGREITALAQLGDAQLDGPGAGLPNPVPGVSKVGDKGTTPSVDQRPSVTFKPTFPVMHAGIRTEPAVSLPKASSAEPPSRLTPAPLDEPPGARCAAGSHGL